jgi:hypothetical protein
MFSEFPKMVRDTAAVARPTFPVYLLPSFKVPFRRRQTDSSTSSSRLSYDGSILSLGSSPESSTVTTPSSSPPFPSYFNSQSLLGSLVSGSSSAKRLSRTNPDTLRCGTCSVDLAFCSQIVSKGFTGRYGRAYLVSAPSQLPDLPSSTDLINIRVGKPENRQLVTGAHVVADISCVVCSSKLGWKYVDAKEQSQKYKVGKFILETQRVVGYRSWEDVLVPEVDQMDNLTKQKRYEDVDEVVFDSDDEDECEDIFAGTWDAEVVAKRRSKKFNGRRKQSSE